MGNTALQTPATKIKTGIRAAIASQRTITLKTTKFIGLTSLKGSNGRTNHKWPQQSQKNPSNSELSSITTKDRPR